MGTTRAQQVSNSAQAEAQAEVNKVNAAAAASVPALRIVVEDNATALQSNTAAIQRLEELYLDLVRGVRETPSGTSGG